MAEWTAAEIATLREMWISCTTRRIAEKLPGRSRNAVIGQARRLGMARKPSSIRPKGYNSGGKKPNQPKKRDVRRLDIKIVRESGTRAALPKLPPVEPLARRVLAVGTCCWPTSNGRPWTFCEAPAMDGRPYCAAHHDLAYQQRPLARL